MARKRAVMMASMMVVWTGDSLADSMADWMVSYWAEMTDDTRAENSAF